MLWYWLRIEWKSGNLVAHIEIQPKPVTQTVAVKV